jgi:hypothetical protein
MVVLVSGAPAAAGKPDPTPDWRCRVTLRDAGLDTVKSDGAGAYVDGAGGVTCYIVNEPGATHDRWLFLSITGTKRTPPTRFMQYVGQAFEGRSYPSFRNHGTFEVKGLAKVPWTSPASARDVMPFRSYLRHPDLPFADGLGTFNGDSNIIGTFGYDGTSSVFVQPIDACSWQVTSYTTEEPDPFVGVSGERMTRTTPRTMRLEEGGQSGDFPMAFQATVTKLGCS